MCSVLFDFQIALVQGATISMEHVTALKNVPPEGVVMMELAREAMEFVVHVSLIDRTNIRIPRNLEFISRLHGVPKRVNLQKNVWV